ncbi:NADH:flavin oxidoreductase [Gammaproteobacteria bacterium 45_16_T64]|nr:NADH:flavin oxidoreductase [Gammaproteobacteria bacterium 45_16_T64]
MSTTIDSPLQLPCGVTLNNRVLKSAMTEGMATPAGEATQQLTNLYQRWAEGATGLLITGNVMVDNRYLERPGNVCLEDETGFSALQSWANAGNSYNNQTWMQISHPGRQVAKTVSRTPVAPSPVQLNMGGYFGKPRSLTESDIEDIIQRFTTTASIAKKAGFGGVQIHAAHGYLISEFLSPVVNQRQDQWGGSLENRARLLLEVVRNIRSVVGKHYPISVKLNSADFQKGGFTLEECVQVAQMLELEKIDLLEISGGSYEQTTMFGVSGDQATSDAPRRESTIQREAYFLDYAKTIRSAIKTPLAVTGGFRSAATMTEALLSEEVDIVGLARPFCYEPDLTQKLIDGDIDHLPAYENTLQLGNGKLGVNSPSKMMKLLNVQAQVAWFSGQLYRMSNHQEPLLTAGLKRSYAKQMWNETRLAFLRKFA